MGSIIPIHNSDIQSFKGCRRRWDILSDIRQGRKPIETPRPFDVGTASHEAFAFFYNPKTWSRTLGDDRPVMVAGAIGIYKHTLEQQRARYVKLMKIEGLSPEQIDEHEAEVELGTGMLNHYFDYVRRHDCDRFQPIMVEKSFEVPILENEDNIVVYRGRIDALVLDEWGQYWIVDWKTALQFRDNMGYLELDEQLGSYNWALQQVLGLPIAGNIYAEIRKAYPLPPPRLQTTRKGCNFSTNRQNATSYELALQTFTEAGEDLMMYEEYLNFLRVEGFEYVRRIQVHRNQHELKELGERIKGEALDMLNPNLRLYPSPSPFKCNGCPVRPICIGMNDGSDVNYLMETFTTIEQRTNA